MAQVTVKDLYKACEEEIRKGNGDKPIVIADDNEGNNYHGMFYLFTDPARDDPEAVKSGCYPIYDSHETDPTKVMVLG